MLTGFVGVLYFDGRQIDRDDAMQLARSMDQLPCSQIETIDVNALALAVAKAPNQKHFNNRKTIFSRDHLLFTGNGSVYNRQELTHYLECKEDDEDLQIMWKAWLKWGNNAPSYLDGDWMFAAYDSKNEVLLIARSWGHSSLYYYLGSEFIAFATHPMLLTALQDVPHEPDLEVIARRLCVRPVATDFSCWKGIKQLEPGSHMKVCRRKIEKHVGWRPFQLDRIVVKDEREILELFVDLYKTAVRKRLRAIGEVGSTLSAGLDSTSVSILAAQELELSDKKLYTWTSVPSYPEEAVSLGNWLTDESALALKAIAGQNNIQHVFVDAADVNIIESIFKQILRSGRPQAIVANQYWLDEVLSLASVAGCSVLLIGQLGNGTVSWTPSYQTILPKKEFFPNITWNRYLRFLKTRLKEGIKQIKSDIQGLGTPRELDYPVMNEQYISNEIFKQMIMGEDDFASKCYRMEHLEAPKAHMNIFDTWYYNSFWNGVDVRDPTMDLELIEFLLALPENMFLRDTLDRRVLRLGMQGVLPDEVRLNKRRGQQASDIVPRVRKFGEQAEAAIACIKASGLACEILNITQMEQTLQRARQGETGVDIWRDCSRILFAGLSAGFFLASFDTNLKLTKSLQENLTN